MPLLTPNEKRKLVIAQGLNPDQYQVNETDDGGAELVPTASGQGQPTANVGWGNFTTTAQEEQTQVQKPADNTPSLAGSVGREALRSIPSAVAGAGTLAGLAPYLATMGTALTGAGAAADATGVGLVPGLITGGLGLGAAGLASYLTRRAQDAAIPALLPKSTADAYTQSEIADQAAHPYGVMAGGVLANMAGGMNPALGLSGGAGPVSAVKSLVRSGINARTSSMLTSAEKANLLNVGLGAILPPAQAAATSAVTGQPLDAKSIALESLLGSIFSKPSALGQKLYGFHQLPEQLGDRYQDVGSKDNSKGTLPRPDQMFAPTTADYSTPLEQDLMQTHVPIDIHDTETPLHDDLMAQQAASTVEPKLRLAAKTADVVPQTEVKLNDETLGKLGYTEEDKAKLTPDDHKTLSKLVELGYTGEDIQSSPKDYAWDRIAELDIPKKDNPSFREQPASDRPPYVASEVPDQTENTGKVPNWVYNWFSKLGVKMGAKLSPEGGLINPQTGEPTKARGLVEARDGLKDVIARVNVYKATPDTIPHEAVIHPLLEMLENSPKGADQRLVKRMYSVVEQSPEFIAHNADRAAKGLPAHDANEWITEHSGKELVRMVDQNDSNLNRDLVSAYKVRFGNPTMEDITRFISSRAIHGEGFNQLYKETKGIPYKGQAATPEPKPELKDNVIQPTETEMSIKAEEKLPAELDATSKKTSRSSTSEYLLKRLGIEDLNSGTKEVIPESDSEDVYLYGNPVKNWRTAIFESRASTKQLAEKHNKEIDEEIDEEIANGKLPSFAEAYKFDPAQKGILGPKDLLKSRAFKMLQEAQTLSNQDIMLSVDPVKTSKDLTKAQLLEDKARAIFEFLETGKINSPLINEDLMQNFRTYSYDDVNKAQQVQKAKDKPLAPATYHGKQDFGEDGSIELYNLTQDIPGHPKNSTVSKKTLEAKGYRVNPPDKVRYQEEEQPAKTPDYSFTTSAERLLTKPNIGGLIPDKAGTYPSENLRARLEKSVPKDEWSVLKEAGIEDYLKKRGRVSKEDVQSWLAANGPKVEVRKFGEKTQTPEQKEYAKMYHEWIDTLDSDVSGNVGRAARQAQLHGIDNNADFNSYKNQAFDNFNGTMDEQKKFRANFNKYIDLAVKVGGQGGMSTDSSSHWQSIAPKSESQMPGYVEIAVVKPHMGNTPTKYGDKLPDKLTGKPAQFPSSHNFPPNTLAFVRGYMENGANGKKTFHVIETQSDWAKQLHDLKTHEDFASARGEGYGDITHGAKASYLQKVNKLSDPLLHDYERLALKAAIQHALKEGATHIAISDAETAMMTEGHDRNLGVAIDMKYPDGHIEVAHGEGQKNYHEQRGATEISRRADRLSQEPGMRLHYDQTLQDTMAKLTGAKGTKESFGEHKMTKSQLPFNGTAEDGSRFESRKDLIFRNTDGTPKTDVSALTYPLEGVRGKLANEADNKFSLFAKFQGPEDESPSIPTKKEETYLGPLTSRIDKIAATLKTATAREVTGELRKLGTHSDRLEGILSDKLNGAMKGYKPEEIARVLEQRHAISTGQDVPFQLTDREAALKEKWDEAWKIPLREALKEGMQVKSKDTGFFRDAIEKPEGYQPSMFSEKVREAIKNDRPEAAEYEKAYTDYAISKGFSPAEAKEAWDIRRSSMGNAGTTPSTKFGALRKVEGIGLPWSLSEHNAPTLIRRYTQRAANDIAYHKYVEANPRMIKALGVKDQYGRLFKDIPDSEKPNTSDINEIGHTDVVKQAMRSVLGIDKHQMPVMNTAIRAVSAGIMQTGTGLRNLLQLGPSIAPYYGVNPHTIVDAVSQMGKRTEAAIRNGAIKGSFLYRDAAGDFEGSPNAFVSHADNVIKLMRKYTGRDLLDHLESSFAYSLGETLAPRWIAMAKNGDIQARAMLRRFGTTIDGGVENLWSRKESPIGQDDIGTIAKEFSDAVVGTYGASGLPSAAIEGPAQPFLSLARWSIERSNTFKKDVIEPLRTTGNWMPLLKVTMAGLMSGAAIEQLNQLLSNKKSQDASVTETLAAGRPDDMAAKAIGLLQLGSYAGLLGDLAKFGVSTYQGKDLKFDQPLSLPSATLAEETAQNVSNMLAAIHHGEDPFQVLGKFIEETGKNSLQDVRYVLGNTVEAKENAKKDKLRDVTVFNELTHVPKSDAVGASNPFDNLEAKEYKKTTDEDIGKIGEELPKVLADYVRRFGSNPELLRSKLQALKTENYDTMPNPTSMPLSFFRYLNYLKQTQGEEAASSRLVDYMKQNAINKAKGDLIPSI